METTSFGDSLNDLLIELEVALQENSGITEIQVYHKDLARIVEAISNDTILSCEVVSSVDENGLIAIRISHPSVREIKISGGVETQNELPDDYYRGYDARYRLVYEHGGERFEMKKPNPEISLLIAAGVLTNDMDVIDLGCGEGRDSLALARRKCKKVCAVDISQAALDKLTEDAQRENLSNLEPVNDDLTTLGKIGDGSFDFAMNMGALHMLVKDRDRQMHLQQVLRILKPGGLFLVKHSREWLKGFRTVVWGKIQQAILKPGDVIPRRIWTGTGEMREIDMPFLPHRVAEPENLVTEVTNAGFTFERNASDTKEGGFGNSYSILFRKPL
ncbi:class I SAM-dependent methyltransferase [Patescibacteria group bacterium]|nr:class I SAM-dependent methyltransferase [Patescibacteria group bacterium]MBU1703616.1 class I SAM-dependent methyltransferase [Patescibacteria group bacterium]MBU1953553.1 class I SAM-dependent methyltransferase [Patescibacteria group bacterium]